MRDGHVLASLVDCLAVFRLRVGRKVELDLPHAAGDGEWRAVTGRFAVDGQAVVAADVHAAVAREPDGDSLVQAALADLAVVGPQGYGAARARPGLVGVELHADRHVAGWQWLG